MDDKDQEKLLLDIAEKVTQMHTLVCDTNGNEGLCTQFRKLRSDYYKFKRNILIATAFVVGSGGISYGLFQLII